MKQTEVEEQEILRVEKELVSTVRLPAESEGYRLETIAMGKRTQVNCTIIQQKKEHYIEWYLAQCWLKTIVFQLKTSPNNECAHRAGWTHAGKMMNNL